MKERKINFIQKQFAKVLNPLISEVLEICFDTQLSAQFDNFELYQKEILERLKEKRNV